MVTPPDACPVVCLTCLYPLESARAMLGHQMVMGLRHPSDLAADHPEDPGYARACALCASPGPQVFIVYARQLFGVGAPVGAVNVCTACDAALDRGAQTTVVDRALALLDPGTAPEIVAHERARVTAQLVFLDQHRQGPSRRCDEIVAEPVYVVPSEHAE